MQQPADRHKCTAKIIVIHMILFLILFFILFLIPFLILFLPDISDPVSGFDPYRT